MALITSLNVKNISAFETKMGVKCQLQDGWLLSAHIIEPIYPSHPHVGNSILMPKFLVRTFDHENGMFESMVCIRLLQLFGHFRWTPYQNPTASKG
jgi:hypothetical protein